MSLPCLSPLLPLLSQRLTQDPPYKPGCYTKSSTSSRLHPHHFNDWLLKSSVLEDQCHFDGLCNVKKKKKAEKKKFSFLFDLQDKTCNQTLYIKDGHTLWI